MAAKGGYASLWESEWALSLIWSFLILPFLNLEGSWVVDGAQSQRLSYTASYPDLSIGGYSPGKTLCSADVHELNPLPASNLSHRCPQSQRAQDPCLHLTGALDSRPGVLCQTHKASTWQSLSLNTMVLFHRLSRVSC